MLDLTELPDEIAATATMAMISENPKLQGILEVFMDYILKQEDAKDLKMQHDKLVSAFTKAPPPSLDDSEIDPASMAKSLVGMGLVISIHNEFGDYVQQTLHAIVDGTREMVENISGFTEENI